MTEHAKLMSPSAAARWVYCTQSPFLQTARKAESEYMATGTGAHKLAERKLINPALYLNEFKGHTIYKNVVVDQDMIDNVKAYVKTIFRIFDPETDKLLIEKRVKLTEDCFGTLDAGIIKPKELHVIDLKYGQGVQVLAEHNEQLMIYALALLYDLKPFKTVTDEHTVTLHVYQPRYRDNEPHKQWTISLKDLLTWGQDVLKPAIKNIVQEKNLVFFPSEKTCKWCSYKGCCEALNKSVVESVQLPVKQDNLSVDDRIKELSNDQLSQIMQAKSLFQIWISGVETEALNRKKAGQDIPGYVLKNGSKNRIFDPAISSKINETVEYLVGPENAYTKKLISPAQTEKHLKKSKKELAEMTELERSEHESKLKMLNTIIIKPEGEPQLFYDPTGSDTATAKNDFKDLIEN